MRPRTRRWLRRTLLGFAALVVTAISTALIVLHTDWGREQIRQRALAVLRDTFPGCAEVARLDGSVLGDLDVHGVVLCDASGRPAVTVAHLRVNLGLRALLGGELELETLDAAGVQVLVEMRPGQPVNLATMMKSSGEPQAWDISLPQVRVRDLDVTIDRNGEIEHLDDLTIDAAAHIPKAGPTDFLLAVTGVARERGGAPVVIAARAWIDDSGVVVPSAQVVFGKLAVEVHAFSYLAATELPGAVSGAVAVLAPDAELLKRLPGAGLPAAIDARIGIDLAIQPGQSGLAAVDGEILVAGSGGAAGVVLERIDAAARVQAGVAHVDARARGAGPTTVAASGEVTMIDDAIVLTDGRVDASVASLAKASDGRAPADGAVRLELDVDARMGLVTTLDVRGEVHGRGLTADALRIGDAKLTFSAAGQPRAIRGEIRFEGRDMTNGAELLPDVGLTVRGGVSGPLSIDLDARSRTWTASGKIGAQVVLAPPDSEDLLATITLGEYRFELPRARIEGRGGRITLEADRTIVEGVRMRGAGATLAVDATAGRGPRAGQLDARIELTRLTLDRLRGVPGLPPDLGGTLAVEANVRQRGRAFTGSVQATGKGVVLKTGASPVDLMVNGDLQPRRLDLGVRVEGAALGSFAAIVNVVPPRRLTDVAAWTRLERAAITDLQVHARKLDLARLSELAGQDPSIEGMIDAELALNATAAGLELHGRGLIMGGAPAPLDLELTLDLTDPSTIQVGAHATLRELAEVTLATHLGMPSRPFDPVAWRGISVRSLHELDLTLHEVNIDDARARRFGLQGMRGKVAATIHAEKALKSVAIHVVGRDIIAGPLVTPAAVIIDAKVDATSATTTIAFCLDRLVVVSGDITVPIGLTRLLAGEVDVRALPLAGTLTIAETPVATLTRALNQDRRLGGVVRGTAKIAGTVAAPEGTLALVVNDLGARGRRGEPPRGGIRELTVDARYRAGAITGEVHGQAADGGKLDVVAAIDPAIPTDARASISATKFQLGPLARLAPTALLGVRGVLDADLQLRGLDPETARVTGVARITGGQLPLADVIGNLRDATIDVSFRGPDLRLTMNGAVEAGRVAAVATARLTGLLPDSGELDVTVTDIELVNAAAPKLDGKLRVELVRDADRWRAVARVHGARVEVPLDEGRELHPAGLPGDMVFTSDLRPGMDVPRTRAMMLSSWLGVRPSQPLLEVRIVIEPVTVVADQLRGEVKGELLLAIGEDGASIDGRIGVTRGKVMLFDRRYGIRRADLAFDGGIDPLLDIQLEYEFPQLTMRVGLTGRLSKPTLQLASDPGTYTEGQLLSFLVGGSPSAPGTVDSAPSVSGVAASAAAQLVGGYFVGKLPVRIDVVNYEGVSSTSSGAFVVGRWVTSTVLLLLRTRFEPRPDENANEAEVEMWLNPRLLFEGVAGDRGVLGADLLWNRRW